MTRVHLITGFLGTGKTTAILDLLKQVPTGEKWAVLVNEFGEVGVDGAILEASGAVVREVPGGCLCCVSGLPFQMGLNMLLAKEKPDVLLIEPTGLGHPRKVLQTLQSEHYRDVLTAGANVCLVDPRQLSDPRYTDNDTFHDQIALADILIANKSDLCTDDDLRRFDQLVSASQPAKLAAERTQYGHLDIQLLALSPDSHRLELKDHCHHHHESREAAAPISLEDGEAFRRIEGHGAGHHSLGWLINGDWQFSLAQLRHWFDQLEAERAKALINTSDGCYVLNWRDGVLSEMPTRALEESRIEIITGASPNADTLETTLFACRVVD
jgi:G3E family GTPase